MAARTWGVMSGIARVRLREWRTCSRRYSVTSWLFISSAAEELVISDLNDLNDCSSSSSPLASLSSGAGIRIGPGGNAIGTVGPLASTSGRRLPHSMRTLLIRVAAFPKRAADLVCRDSKNSDTSHFESCD